MTDLPNITEFLATGQYRQRTTREVAEQYGVSLATARKRLHKLWDAKEIEAYDGGASGTMGNAILWGPKEGPS